MKNIEMIDVRKLYAHPNNPRKDIGDITELADSIKANGIFQNLTVVPKEIDTYTVIIGHRRLAAAKRAGLREVPCVIANMNEKEQIGTMLLENMQRSDLTLVEQAEGFQLMLDFGDSIEVVAEKTGFSESTVRRRIKMLSLDKQKLRDAEKRGGTLEEYIRVAEIKNESERDKVTDSIGTSNFEWKLRDALKKQMLDEKMPFIKKELKKIGAKKDDTIHTYTGGYQTALRVAVDTYEEGDFERKLKLGKEYWWNVSYGDVIYIYEKTPKKKAPKKSDKEILAIELRGKLKEVSDRAWELRRDFVSNFSACIKYADILNEWLWELQFRSLSGEYSQKQWDVLCEKIGEEKERNKYCCERENLDKLIMEHPENAPIVILSALSGDGEKQNYYYEGFGEYAPTFVKNKTLDLIYEYLCKLGYEMSDEEKALQDGSHELLSSAETLDS